MGILKSHLVASVLFIAVLGLSFASRADDDPWFGTDKWIHFGASAGMTGVGYGVFSPVLAEPWQRALAGSGVSLTIGSLKELADATNGSVASWRDMTWNAIGTAVGAGISMGLDYLIRSAFARSSSEDQMQSPIVFFQSHGTTLQATLIF